MFDISSVKKFQDRQIYVKFTKALEIESLSISLQMTKTKKEIESLHIYVNNSNTDLSDLKGKMGLWKKIRSINFQSFKDFSHNKKNKIRIPFPITI